MKSAAMIKILAVSSALAAFAVSVLAEPPRAPASGPPKDFSRGGGGERRGPYAGMGRPPIHHDAFDRLPEPEKQKLRKALERVWSRPEVMAARDRVMKANEDLRDAIHSGLQAIDPEAAAIVERIRPPDHFDPRKLPELPPPDSDEFPRAAVKRLEMETIAFARPEHRDESQKLHEKVIGLPAFKEAMTRAQQSRGEARIDAIRQLRDRYRELLLGEFRANHEQRRGPDGDKPPPPPPSKPPGEGEGKAPPR